jgi:hypothetical protein
LAIRVELILALSIILLIYLLQNISLQNFDNSSKDSNTDIRFDNILVYELTTEGTKSNLSAKVVKLIKDKTVAIDFIYKKFNSDGTTEELKALKGLYEDNILTINSGFNYQNIDLELNGESFTYNIKSEIAKSGDKFKLKRGNSYISGSSFLYQDSKFMSKNIKSIIEVNQ